MGQWFKTLLINPPGAKVWLEKVSYSQVRLTSLRLVHVVNSSCLVVAYCPWPSADTQTTVQPSWPHPLVWFPQCVTTPCIQPGYKPMLRIALAGVVEQQRWHSCAVCWLDTVVPIRSNGEQRVYQQDMENVLDRFKPEGGPTQARHFD